MLTPTSPKTFVLNATASIRAAETDPKTLMKKATSKKCPVTKEPTKLFPIATNKPSFAPKRAIDKSTTKLENPHFPLGKGKGIKLSTT